MKIFMLLAFVGVLGGCATIEDSVPIKYIPTTATAVDGAQPVNLKVEDGRAADRSRISTKMNGYGVEMAAIRSASDVSSVVLDALKTEFDKRGFHADPNGQPVTVTINRFYNQYSTGVFSGTAQGNADLDVTISDSKGVKLYSHSYAGASTMSIQLANGSNAAESVAAALKDAVTKMFADPAFVGALTKAGERVS